MNFSKSLINHIVKVLFILLLTTLFSFAQTRDTTDNSADSVFIMQKSPWGAVLRSAILPGWGQFYNESYIKVPVIWGGITALVLAWRYYDKRYKNNRNLYIQTGVEGYKTYRDFYRDQRDLYSIYIGLAYLLNLVDAYVDAELFDFTVEENNLIHLPMMGIRFNF